MSALDVIELVGVTARGHHGVLDREKIDGQEFAVDVRMHADIGPAAAADALARTVDYAAVADTVVEEIATGSHDLLETLADRIARRILSEHVLVRRLQLTVHKPSAPIPHPFADVRLHVDRAADPVDAVLALGTNLGDRDAHLRRALQLLEQGPGVQLRWTGPVLETDPVGGVDQDPFLNTAVGVRTDLGPWQLLELAHRLEAAAHRERQVRWGPRTLDVDVITYGELIQDDADLTLPHPRAHQRAFVLAPWSAAEPGATVPTRGRVRELLAGAPDRDGVRPGPGVDGFGAL